MSRQYGFRAGKSTVDATLQVVKTAESTIAGKKFCLAVSLDIENAFNLMLWQRIIDSLQKTNTPKYLVKIIDSYLSDRKIQMETATQTVIIVHDIWSISQGSVPRPTL